MIESGRVPKNGRIRVSIEKLSGRVPEKSRISVSTEVKKQEAAYQEVINDIWGKQKETLEDATTYDDADVQPQEDEDERLYPQTQPAATPRFDESMSVFSRPSATSTRHGKRKLRIQRKQYRADGTEEWIDEIVEDPGVIAQYIKSRRQLDEETLE